MAFFLLEVTSGAVNASHRAGQATYVHRCNCLVADISAFCWHPCCSRNRASTGAVSHLKLCTPLKKACVMRNTSKFYARPPLDSCSFLTLLHATSACLCSDFGKHWARQQQSPLIMTCIGHPNLGQANDTACAHC